MPLKKGKSKKAMGANYRKLTKEGYRGKQRTAIMLRVAGKARKRATRKAAKRTTRRR